MFLDSEPQDQDVWSALLDSSVYLFANLTLKDLELMILDVVATLLFQALFSKREVIAEVSEAYEKNSKQQEHIKAKQRSLKERANRLQLL